MVQRQGTLDSKTKHALIFNYHVRLSYDMANNTGRFQQEEWFKVPTALPWVHIARGNAKHHAFNNPKKKQADVQLLKDGEQLWLQHLKIRRLFEKLVVAPYERRIKSSHGGTLPSGKSQADFVKELSMDILKAVHGEKECTAHKPDDAYDVGDGTWATWGEFFKARDEQQEAVADVPPAALVRDMIKLQYAQLILVGPMAEEPLHVSGMTNPGASEPGGGSGQHGRRTSSAGADSSGSARPVKTRKNTRKKSSGKRAKAQAANAALQDKSAP